MRSMRRLSFAFPPLLIPLLALAGCSPGNEPFDQGAWEEQEADWREEVEATLTSDRSWLTVAGLHFLTAGEHTVGSGASDDLRLPDRFPSAAVRVTFDPDGRAYAEAAEGVEATLHGETFTSGELEIGEANAIVLDDRISFWLHTSGDRRALRLRDLDRWLRATFTGRVWYPLDPKYRVEARFERYGEERPIKAVNIRGDLEDYVSHGEAVFDLDGETIRMQAFTRSNGNLFFVMTDRTSGVETYPAARFLTVPPPEDGRVVMDFNRAVNPPCGFSEFTTCPTPPAQNRLPIRVEAGEKRYHRPPGPTD